jgi:GDP-mannose pyrophosphatase NudK
VESTQASGPLQILVAGPLRGGTGDDPVLIRANVDRMEEAAAILFDRGHLPIVGEWLSFPLIERAGSTSVGDAAYERIQHPLGVRLVRKCDLVLRLPGPSSGSDLMVATAVEAGIPVVFSLADISAVV